MTKSKIQTAVKYMKGQMTSTAGVMSLLFLVIVLVLLGMIWILGAGIGERFIQTTNDTIGNGSAYYNDSLAGVNEVASVQGDFIPLGVLAAVGGIIIGVLIAAVGSLFMLSGGLGRR